MEGFELFSPGVEEKNSEPETIDADITGIERRILRGTGGHSLLNKGNYSQGPRKALSLWWLLLDSQSTMDVIMNKEIFKDIRDVCGRFVRVHCNAVTRIIRTEATLPVFGTVCFDNRCITNIISLSKAKNK